MNQTFEAFVFASVVSWYRKHRWRVRLIHPGQSKTVKLKFNTRGKPGNYTFAECRRGPERVRIGDTTCLDDTPINPPGPTGCSLAPGDAGRDAWTEDANDDGATSGTAGDAAGASSDGGAGGATNGGTTSGTATSGSATGGSAGGGASADAPGSTGGCGCRLASRSGAPSVAGAAWILLPLVSTLRKRVTTLRPRLRIAEVGASQASALSEIVLLGRQRRDRDHARSRRDRSRE